MAIPQFKVMKLLPAQNTPGRRHPETYAVKAALKPGILIVAGIIGIVRAMNLVRREIFGRRLVIIPVKWRNGKEWRNFIRDFQVCRIGIAAPVIHIIAVIGTQNYIIIYKIVKPETQRQFKPRRWQLFYCIFFI
jgi:hypothetical protein